MNTKQRFKLGAGAGLVTMLLGALMVLAPAGAGAAQLDPVPIDANTCPQDGYDPGTEKINAGDVPSVFVEAPAGFLIDGYCVKTGSEASGDGPLWIAFDPPVASTTITYPGKDTISHYAVSYVPVDVPAPASLTVEKVVVGLPDATAIPAEWSETIDIESIGASNPVSDVAVDQGDLSTAQNVAAGTYQLDELGSDGAGMALTDIECTEANGAVTSSSTLLDAEDLRGGIEVTLDEGSDMTCVFTNTYTAPEVLPEEEEPGSITIVKAVQGTPPPAGWAFGFNVSGGIGQAILTNADSDAVFASVAAGTYTIVEDANASTTLESIVCTDPEAVSNGRTVSIDVAEGEDVTCTFTNVFTEQVLGAQTVRTLPRTGDGTRNLAGVGALMLAMGAAMVISSRRQLARR